MIYPFQVQEVLNKVSVKSSVVWLQKFHFPSIVMDGFTIILEMDRWTISSMVNNIGIFYDFSTGSDTTTYEIVSGF